MSWDDTKKFRDLIEEGDWNNMVTNQKENRRYAFMFS
jgi:hypothetical protein